MVRPIFMFENGASSAKIRKVWTTVEAWAFRPTIKRKKEAGFSP
jgi:hypothetical protein